MSDHYCAKIQTIIPIPEKDCAACKGQLDAAALERYKREWRKPHTMGKYKRELWIPVQK